MASTEPRSINTRTLDHIVYLTPPDTLEAAAEEFRRLGFQVLPGGVHADSLTANALVVFEDHSYIEIINFTHPVSYYPPGSPLRLKRESHQWSESFKQPGFVDFAFLGNGSLDPNYSISATINKRAKEDGNGLIYAEEQKGGRTRPDGKVLKWLISAPESNITTRGVLPFFCGDVTPRELRVPTDPSSNTEHPSGAKGVSEVQVLIKPGSSSSHLHKVREYFNSVVGKRPTSVTETDITWNLSTLNDSVAPILRISVPTEQIHHEYLEKHGEGIYKVSFRSGKAGAKGDDFLGQGGKVAWVAEV